MINIVYRGCSQSWWSSVGDGHILVWGWMKGGTAVRVSAEMRDCLFKGETVAVLIARFLTLGVGFHRGWLASLMEKMVDVSLTFIRN